MVLTGILAAAHTDGVPDPELGGGGLEAPRWEPVVGGSSRSWNVFEGRLPWRRTHRSAGQRRSGRSHRSRERHHPRQRVAGGAGREGGDQGRVLSDPPPTRPIRLSRTMRLCIVRTVRAAVWAGRRLIGRWERGHERIRSIPSVACVR